MNRGILCRTEGTNGFEHRTSGSPVRRPDHSAAVTKSLDCHMIVTVTFAYVSRHPVCGAEMESSSARYSPSCGRVTSDEINQFNNTPEMDV
ncbi:hypothetical protein RRG08_022011 [Elysia crispata]|uniref:Uncharacterized protein n=1 Tax=Elysia crispata TaxID=231223 RepID=A0AAE1AA44_9GAST|nr:hypothetical protein RRG08_022011 [Elysia crispata]